MAQAVVMSGDATISSAGALVLATVPIAKGGTNSTTTLNNNRVMVSSGGAIVETAAITASRALVSNASGIPTAATTTSTEIGYLASSAVTNGGIIYGNGSAFRASAAGTSGQILISGGAAAPTWATPTIDGSGNLTATGFFYSSDRRLKHDIRDIKGLETILALHGVSFKWNKSGDPEVGLIAQEVEAVLPELVHTDPKTGMKAVKYGNLVAPLIESVKDLYGMCEATAKEMARVVSSVNRHEDEIKTLQERVKSLEEDNQQLHREIEEIKRLLKK